MTTTYVEVDQFYADAEATKAAEQAITAMMLKYGSENFYCGFATIYYGERIRKNSQTAKGLTAIGFHWNDYYKRMEKPAPYRGQSMDFAEASAHAYADRFNEITGLKMRVTSRAD